MANDLTQVQANGVQPMVLVQTLMQRPDFTTDMLRDLLDMVKEQEHRASLRVFRAAFSRCQAKVTKAEKDKPNPLFNSRYATLEAMYDAVWPAVMEEGFSWTVSALPQAPEGWDNSVLWFQGRLSMDVVTETVELPVPRAALSPEGPRGQRAAMTPMQAVGALTTYMRKYLLGLMFGVVTAEDVRVDNDGNDGKSDTRREEINRDVPLNGNGKNAQDRWLDKLEEAAAAVATREAWDVLWTTPTIVQFSLDPKNHGAAMTRYQEIQLRHSQRLFPTAAEKETVDADQQDA